MTALTDMLPTAWAEVLDELTYKPNVEFRLEPQHFGRHVEYRFQIHTTVPDSRSPAGTVITVVHQTMVPRWLDDDRHHIIAFVRQCIHNMETHEADEFLRIGGELVNNPHARSDR